MPSDDSRKSPAVILPSEQQRRRAEIYGYGFPDLSLKSDEKIAEQWIQWAKQRVRDQRDVMQDKRLHWARHRLFRQGRQWISSRDGRAWRELAADENRIRAVFDLIGPALDFRVSLLQEQQPGFKFQPMPGSGVDGRETALAQQSVVEWHFYQQKIWPLIVDALVNAQTDGVTWLNVYIDKDSGPLLENIELVEPSDSRYETLKASGYKRRDSGLLEVPLTGDGSRKDPGERASRITAGEIRTRLLLAHETWADPEAHTINGADRRARWFMVRRVRDLRSVRIQLNDDKLEADVDEVSPDPLDLASNDLRGRFQRGLPPYPTTRASLPEGGIYENLIYLAPSKEFPGGKWVEVVTKRHMRTGRLPGRVIPVARMTDGSTDPELYPRPVMSSWIGDQMAINALGSKILEYSRLHSGSRVLALQGTTLKETWTDIVGSIVEYKGPKPDVLNPPRVSPDMWNAWTHMIRQLEQKTGWNDVARGQLTGEGGFQDVAGRAVLAARELFERQFGPMIRAAAEGASDWAELIVRYAQHFYKTPRLIPRAGRADLAKHIDSDKLRGQPVVYVDPETLQPLPRALRNQLLTDYLDRGLISTKEFQKRAPFAEVRDLNMGDTDQWERAQTMNMVIESRWEELAEMEALDLYAVETGLPIFWQDDVDIHMRALEELIFDDKKPFRLRKIAADRWGIYMELGRSKEFPAELELQGIPRPPAPAEVLGVPNSVRQLSAPLEQQVAEAGGDVPGGAPGAAPAPELSPQALPDASTDQPQPLGAFGAEEAQLQ